MLAAIGRFITNSLFRFLLFFGGVVLAISLTVNSSNIKSALYKNNIYDKVFDALPSSVEKKSEGLSFSDPEIISALKKSISPQQLQNIVESVVDEAFLYLDGTSDGKLDIDIKPYKETLANRLATYAINRAKRLPVCSGNQITIGNITFDPFQAVCRPSNVRLTKAVIVKSITQNESIPDAISIDFTLLFDKNLQQIAKQTDAAPIISTLNNTLEQAQAAQDSYQALRTAPYVLLSLGLLCGALHVLLHKNKRRGLHLLSTSLMTNSVFLVLSSVFAAWVLGKTMQNGQEAQALYTNVANTLAKQFNIYLVWIGGAFFVTGFLVWAALLLTKKKYSGPSPDSEEEELAQKAIENEPKTGLGIAEKSEEKIMETNHTVPPSQNH